MKYKKRTLCEILLLGWMILFTAGCGTRSEETDLETKIRSEIAKVLPQEEAFGELTIIEKEKTRDTIRYHVYCQMENGEDQVICERCYLVTYRRRNGEWACEEGKGVQLVDEKVVEDR